MKSNLLAAAFFAVALAMPLGVYAQQSQPPPAAQSYGHGTPSEAKLQHRWMKRLGNLNLSGDQQQRIQSLISQYSQAHPQGTPADREANRDLRRQIMGVLTSDQQAQYRQQMQARRAQRSQGQQQQPYGQQQPPDGPSNGQAPPDQPPPNDQPAGPPPPSK